MIMAAFTNLKMEIKNSQRGRFSSSKMLPKYAFPHSEKR